MNLTDNKIKEEFNSNGYASIYSFFNDDKRRLILFLLIAILTLFLILKFVSIC